MNKYILIKFGGTTYGPESILKKLYKPIVEWIVDRFLLQRCQKKRYEPRYDIFIGLQSTNILGNGELSIISLLQYLMKHFEFIDLNPTVWSTLDSLMCSELYLQKIMIVQKVRKPKKWWVLYHANDCIFFENLTIFELLKNVALPIVSFLMI